MAVPVERIARQIADAKAGEARTAADVRDAVYVEAVKQLRLIVGPQDPTDDFYANDPGPD